MVGGEWEGENRLQSGTGAVTIFPSDEWTPWMVNPNTTKGDQPLAVELFLQNQRNAAGIVWIKDVELVEMDPQWRERALPPR
jgi:hypothetical protein